MSYPPQQPFDPPPESPVTPAYGSPPPPYARGQATPWYSRPEQYPLAYEVSPAARRRSRLRLVAGVTIGLVVLGLTCLGGVLGGFAMMNGGLGRSVAPSPPAPATRPSAGPAAPPARPAPTTRPATPSPGGHVVVYEVTGDGPVGITYLKDAKGGTEQVHNVKLPWRVEVRMDSDSFVVTVIALRVGTEKGTLTCRALVDGREVAQHSSSRGNFATATCADLVVG